MTDPQPTVVELLARGYTREQITAWQAAIADDTPQPDQPEEGRERLTRRRKT